jgi:hypothetical protein
MAINRFSQSTAQSAFPKFTNLWDGTTATSSFDSLGSVIVSSATSTVTFSNIPQTYTHLQVRGLSRCSRAATFSNIIQFQFNNDATDANYYNSHRLNADGATASAIAIADVGAAGIWGGLSYSDSALANSFGAFITDILDYTNTNKYKNTRSLQGVDDNNGSYPEVRMVSGLWKNASAINRITLVDNTGTNFQPYSSYVLYGIK